MKSAKYLMVLKNGSMRIVSKLDSGKGGEIPVRLSVNVPDSYWDIPTVAANVNLPERDQEVTEVSATISFAMSNEDINSDEELGEL